MVIESNIAGVGSAQHAYVMVRMKHWIGSPILAATLLAQPPAVPPTPDALDTDKLKTALVRQPHAAGLAEREPRRQ